MSQLLSPFSSLVRPLTVGPRPITAAGGALKRLLAHSQAPVIGIAGTGHPDLTMDLMSAMLRACGIRTTVGLGPALGQLDSLRAEDRVLVEVSGGLLRSPARGLAMLVLGGFAADELAPDQAPWELGDALTRLAAGVDGCVVVNADDARSARNRCAVNRPTRRPRSVWACARVPGARLARSRSPPQSSGRS